jgi:hypothetical protein
MSEQQTKDILALQQAIRKRLLELGYADDPSAARLSRHLAEISVLGHAFYESTLPLFLSIDRDNIQALSQLSVSMKCDLEELADALTDIDIDLRNLMEFLNSRQL